MALVGIMGGTFNPIHMGHIEIAKAAYEQYHLDEIWFMPNHIPAYKSEDTIISGEIRLEMVRLAIKELPYCKASDFELKRQGNTYTIDTLKLLKKEYPKHTFYFIMGADSLFSFDKWREYEQIPNYAKLLVAPRDDKNSSEIIELIESYNSYFGKECFGQLICKEIPCSSSEIRDDLSKGVLRNRNEYATKKHIPEEVLEYIIQNHLYMKK